MNEIFEEKWIRRGVPVAWPPRSPDLTSPDYILWGFVKERVMAVTPPLYKNINELKINCTKILGFFGLWKSPKTNFQRPPLCPKKQPSF